MGITLYVEVTFQDDDGNGEVLTSAETEPVLEAARDCSSEHVWCTTLRVGDGAGEDGFCHLVAGGCDLIYGSLPDRGFTVDSTEYAVESLRWSTAQGPGPLRLTLDQDLPAADLGNWALKVDLYEFKLENATKVNSSEEAHSYEWASAPFGLREFTDGTNVTVELLTLSDTSLSALSVSPGTLSPAFTAGTTSYTVSVAHSVETITVTAEATETSATVTIAPEDGDGGTPDHQVGLDVGQNVISATVVNGTTTGSYTVKVIRAAAPAASFAAATYAVEEGESVEVVVTLDPAPEAQAVIPIRAVPQGTAETGDYSGVPLNLTFSASVMSQTFTVMAVDDSVDDNDESVQLSFGTLPTPVEAGSPVVTTVNLTDNDGPEVTVEFGSETYTVSEDSSVTVTVKLSDDPDRTVVIPITATAQGGATAQGETNADYSGVPASVTFSAGDIRKSFTVTAVDDSVDDDGEGVVLDFGSPLPTGVTAGSPGETTVSLEDDDFAATATLMFGSSSYTATEGGSVAVVTVLLSDDVDDSVLFSVSAALPQDGATPADYTTDVPTGIQRLNGSNLELSFTVTAVDDLDIDGGESVKFSISQIIANKVLLGSPSETTVYLRDDDGPKVTVEFDSSTYTATEGGSAAVVAVNLSESLTVQAVVPITPTNQDGATVADYSGVPPNLTFATGETSKTFTVAATDDLVDDDGEKVVLGFGTLPTELWEGSVATSTVSLVDDDDPEVTVAFGAASYAAAEGGAATVTVELSADPERTVVVTITPTNQDGATVADYSGVPLSVTFTAGDTSKSFTVTATQDTEDDDGESVALDFGTLPERVTASGTTSATVNLTDDDDPEVTVKFGAASYAVIEGGTAAVAVELSADPERTVVVTITTLEQGAATVADYSGVPASVTFTSGQMSASFTVTATQDTEDDDGESVLLGFGTLPTGVVSASPFEAAVAITDDDEPSRAGIDNIWFTSLPTDREYNIGDVIRVAVSFNEAVEVTGTPRVKMLFPDQGRSDIYATYKANLSFDTQLHFKHVVTSNDDNDSAVHILSNGLELNGGSIQNKGTSVDANIDHALVTTGKRIRTRSVTGIAVTSTSDLQSASGNSVYGPGDKIKFTVTFGGAVNVDTDDASPQLIFKSGTENHTAAYESGGGTQNLVFGWTVPATISNDGVALVVPSNMDGFGVYDDLGLVLNGSAITNSEDLALNLRHEDYTLTTQVDTTVPILQSATVDGASLVLTYDEDMNENSTPAASAFTVKVDGSSRSVSSVAVSGKTVTLTLSLEVLDSEMVTVSYGIPSTAPLEDAAGNAAAGLSDSAVSNDTVTVAVTVSFDASSYTAREGGAAATVTVKLSADPERTVVIPITATAQGDTTAQGETDADYSVPASVTLTSGQTRATFTVTAVDDLVDDDGESVTLGFGSPLPTRVTAGSPAGTTVSLEDNDYAETATLMFGSSSYTATEGGSAAVVTVLLSDDVNELALFNVLATMQGGAMGVDYEVDGKLKFVTLNGSKLEHSFTVTAEDDPYIDGGESVKFYIERITTRVPLGIPFETTVSLRDNDGSNVTVEFGSSTYTATEGGNAAVVAVNLSESLTVQAVVPVTEALQGDAISSDYSGVPPSLTFAAGETSKTFTVAATDDLEDDDGESVVLGFGLLPTELLQGSPATSTVSLTDDDDPEVMVAFGGASYAAAEGGTATVTVTLSADPERTVVVTITPTNQDGATAADYSGVPPSVTFTSGQTSTSFTVTATQDTEDDDGESVLLGFGTLPERVTASGTPTATVNITDDDNPEVTVAFGVASYAVVEGGTATVTVELSADPERTVTILLTPSNQNGASGSDYSGVPANVTFVSGETSATFTVTATQDTDDDDGESVLLRFGTLLPTGGVTEGSPATTTVAITDDDDPPPAEITNIRFRNVPSGREYKLGDVIEVITRFDKAVEVTGTPRVKLLYLDRHGFGGFFATYDATSSTETLLVFKRTVTHVDDDESEVRIYENGLERNRGKIRNKGTTVAADISHAGVLDNVPSIRTRSVDDIAVTSTSDVVESVSENYVYGPGDKIEFTVEFKHAVNVDATSTSPQLIFKSGSLNDDHYTAAYESGGGTQNLVFGFTVPTTVRKDEVALVVPSNVDGSGVSDNRGLILNGSAITNSADLALNLRHGEYTLDAQMDTTVPSLQSATMDDASLVLTYDEDLDENSTPAASVFTVKVDGSSRSVSSVAVSGKTVTLTLSAAVLESETVTVSYEIPSTAPLKDVVGNAVAGLSDSAVSNDTVTVAVTVSFDASSYTATEGGTAATVTVKLSADPQRTVVIPITAVPQGDTTDQGETDADYSGVPVSVTFTSGQTSTSFTVTAEDDSVDDDGESVLLGFGTLPGKVTEGSSRTSASVSLVDDDDKPVTVMFKEATYPVAEGGSVVVTVELSADPERALTIGISTTPQGEATAADYTVPSSVTFTSGQTSETFTVTTTPDTEDDDGESVRLGFSSLPSGVTAGSTPTATVNITDDDDPGVTVMFGSATYTATEGGNVEVTVTLSADPERDLTITITHTAQDNATAQGETGADYSGVPANVTFASGETSATFTVTAENDSVDDDDESVELGFDSSLPARVTEGSPATATVALTDDDVPQVTVSFKEATYEAVEGGSNAVVTVELSADPERALTIGISTTPQGEATAADYTVPANVTFAPGETSATFTVTAENDSIDDDDESVELGFDSPLPAGVTEGSTTTATMALTDDDVPPVTVEFTTASDTLREGESLTVTVTLNVDPERALTIGISTTPQDGATAADYTVPSSVTFTAGQISATLTVSATRDGTPDEGVEGVRLDFGTLPDRVTVGSRTSVTVGLTDGDTREVVLSETRLYIYEADENVSETYTVVLGSKPTAAVTVELAVEVLDSLMTLPAVSPTSLTFTPLNWGNLQTVTVTVPHDNDAGIELARVTHTLSGGDYEANGVTVPTVEVTVYDDESQSTLAILTVNHATVPEAAGATEIVVTGTLNGGAFRTEKTITVRVQRWLGVEPEDYTAPSTVMLMIAPQATSGTATFTLTPTNDALWEPEQEAVVLRGTVGGLPLLVQETFIDLVSDDLEPVLSFTASASEMAETGGSVGLAVAITNGVGFEDEQTVALDFSAGNATRGTDYTDDALAGDMLVLGAGVVSAASTVTLMPVHDLVDEDDESIEVEASHDGTTIGTAQRVTILDDDTRAVAVSATEVTVPEGGNATYTVVLGSQPTGLVTVTPGASGNADVTVSGALTFTTANWAVEQTVTVTAAEDTDAEADTATVSHTVSGADYGSETAAPVSVTVTENDVAATAVDLSVSPLRVGEAAGSTNVVVTGTLNGSVRTTATVLTVSVADGTASSGDFAAVTDFMLTIAASAASGTATFTLTPTGDDVDEADETVTVDGTVSGLTVNAATLTIEDDDTRAVVVSETEVTVPEGGSATYTVVLGSQPTGSVTVTPGAGGSTDVTVSGALTFTASNWAMGQTVMVSAAEDADAEVDTATVSHTVSGADYGLETAASVSVTVAENEVASTAVNLSLSLDQAGEGAGGTSVTVTGTLNGTSRTTATVLTVSVTGDTASSSDFTTVTDFMLTIAANTASGTATFTLTPVDDDVDETDETVTVDGTVSGLTVNAATLTIEDDDTRAVVVSATEVTVPEGGNATYTVVLGSQPTGSVTVTPGASGSSDVTVSGALTFTTANWAVEQAVTVSAAEDADAEADTATVSHTVSGADYGSETAAPVAVTVAENEVASTAVNLSLSPDQAGEGAGGTSVTVTGTLDEAPSTAATVLTVSVAGDTASSGDFTTVANFMLTIAANATSGTAMFTLTPVNDDVDEVDETVTVDGTVSGLTVNAATLTIEDDDTRAVVVSETEVTVPEGGSATYTVVLGSKPTGSVTVTPGAGGSTDVTVSGALTFTTSNWAMGQTVMVSAAEDADAEVDTATVSHTVSGADYGSETAAPVSVTVSDNEMPSTAVVLSVDPDQVGEGAGSTSVVVTGTLDEAPSTTATVLTVSVAGDTASPGDFTTVTNFMLTIAANTASGTATFTLTPVDDDVDETDETVTVDGTVSGLTVNAATLTIEDDDTRAVVVSETGVTVPEGGSATYTVVLASKPTGSVTVTLGASGNADVTVSGALTFTTSNWAVEQAVTVSAAEDADAEADTATVSHTVSGADYGSETAAPVAVTVAENEVASTAVNLSLSPDQAGEGAGGTSVTVTGTLDEAPRMAATVLTVSVAGDTASSGDFTTVANFMLTIAANATSGTAMFTLTPVNDDVDEVDETVTVDGTVSGLTVNAATLTIEDDDTRAVVVSATEVTVPEGGSATYTVVLGSQPTGSVTVTPGASGSSDVTVSEALTFTTSNWAVEQSVTVSAAEDADAEADTATVSHTVSGADYGSETAAPVSVTVSDNEMPSTAVVLSVDPDQVGEGAGNTSVVVTGTLDEAPSTTATVLTVSVAGDTASPGDFTTVTDFMLTIAANTASGTATFRLTPVDDDVDETDETVTVDGTVSGLTVNAATLTIEDDDTRAVVVSETGVTVPEGGSATYTIVLASKPTGSVTVTPGVGGSEDVTVSRALTFTTSNWAVEQSVTVSAAEDADAEADTATVSHTVSGADYGSETAAPVAVTVAENEVASTAVNLSLSPDQAGEGAGGTSVTVTGTLDEAPSTTATVLTVSVAGDTASPGDFTTVTNFMLTIVANTASGTATFTLTPVDDDVDEVDETVTVDGTVSGLTVNAATLTIKDDDTRAVVVSETEVTVPEGGNATYTVVLGSQPTGLVTVTPGASGNADVTVSGALTFTTANWAVEQSVTVSAAEDADAEADTATVSHTVSGADYGSETAAPVSVTVTENDVAATAVDLSVSPLRVGEAAGSTNVVVTGTLNGSVRTTATVLTVSVADGTASSGDFAAVTDFMLTIAASAASGTATFTLTPTGDDVDEADETVTVDGTVSGLTVNAATLTIEDDDTRAVVVSETEVTVLEGGSATYTVVLGSQPTGSVTVTPGAGGSTDVTVSGALTFTTSNWAMGQTVMVSAAEDADAEVDTATVSHTVSGADYGLETAASVSVTVAENEVASTAVNLSLSLDQAGEGAGGTSVTVTGTLNGTSRTTATVLTVSVAGDTASPGDFTTVTDFMLTIAANTASGTATFTLTPVDDDVDEADETVTVDGTVSGLTVNAATLTIEDDDTRAVVVSETGVTVPEGGSATYTIVLASKPTGSVTVTPGASGNADVTVSGALTFTTVNWAVEQSVTVSAAEDADAEADTATVSHTVSGADYGSETAAPVAVTVTEDETASTAVALSVSPDQVREDAGSTSVVVTGTLDEAPRMAATVLTVSVTGDTASPGDFTTVTNFMLTIAANATSGAATFTLTPVDDDVDETDETVTVDGTVSGLTVNAATLTIEDDDTRAVVVSETEVTVPEGGSATYTVVLGSQPTGSVTVTPGASGSSDVTVSGALTFTTSNWAVEQSVTVSAAEDADAEADTATVSHTVAGADYDSDTATPVAVTVTEDETASTAVALSVSPDQVGEDAGNTSVVVTGTLDEASSTTATVLTVSVAGDTASPGDFTTVTSFMLTIAANATSGTATFTLTPVNDDVDETDETVTVGGTVSGLTVNAATLTIEDDDTRAVVVSATEVTVPEGGNATYTVVLGSQPTGSVTVTPGASGSSDVTVSGALTFTTVNWAVEQSVTVSAAEDADAEADTATVSHTVSGADYGSETAAPVSVTVSDNEMPSTAVVLSVDPDQVGEDAGNTSVVVTGTLDEAPSTTATVLTVSVAGDTASPGDFTTVTNFMLTIAANATSGTATFTLTPVDDDVDETDETVTVDGTVSGLTVNAATLTIEDNDTRAVVVSETGVTVPEGGSATYTIVLASQPTGSVTVTPGVGGSEDVTVSRALTFTTASWAVEQTVTVSAAEDTDAEADTATVSHTVSGADYDSETAASVSVTVTENDVAATAVDLSVSPLRVGEAAGGTNVVVTGTLNGSARTAATVLTVSVVGDTASSGDFTTVTNFMLTIVANTASGTAAFTLTPVNDDVDETDETVTVDGTVPGLTVNAATLTIEDNDTRAVVVSETGVTVPEGGSATYTIVLASQPTGSVTVTPGASGNADVTVSGALTFTTVNWAVEQSVTVSAAEDADAEADTATVSHTVSGADYGSETAAPVSVTVSDNEMPSTAVALSVDPDQVGEGAGGTSVTVTGTLNGTFRTAATVLAVSVTGDTASSGDFTTVTDFMLTIAANATSGTAMFTLTPVNDAVDETDETVTVDGTVSGFTVNAATLTIEDNDTRAVVVSETEVTVPEGGSATYTVVLASQPTGSVTVTPGTSGNSGVTVSGALTFTTVNWNVEQSVTVSAAQDADAEVDTATVSHAVSGADYGSETVAPVSATVTEDETASTAVNLSLSPDQVGEGAGGTSVVVTGTLDEAPSTAATVLTVSVAGDTASPGDFTTVTNFMLTIAANATSGTATFTLTPVDDDVDETDETVTVDGTVSGLTVNAATLTIEDNDTRAVVVSETGVTVPEGGSATYTIVLASQPTGSVTVTPGVGGSEDVTVSGALTFTTANWAVEQTVTVSAAEDTDAEADTATVSHTVSGADYDSETAASVSVTVTENEAASTAVDLSVSPLRVEEDAGSTSVVVTGTLDEAAQHGSDGTDGVGGG